MARQKLPNLPAATLGKTRKNTRFAEEKARLPSTERYRYPLYTAVALAIAGLLLLQYRVFRRLEEQR